MRKLRVTVEGKAYEVLVEELDAGSALSSAPARSAGPGAPQPAGAQISAPEVSAAAPATAAGPGDVPSPLAGRVVAVNCSAGDVVETGTTLITLEAMKMNTFVQAPSGGTVKAVLVKEGDAVEEGQSLVTLQ